MSAAIDTRPRDCVSTPLEDVGQSRSDPTPCGSRPGWCVIASYPKAERKAHDGLLEQGFEAYLPLSLGRPLFPRYFFLWLDGHTSWRPVLYTRGVYDLIRSRETGIPHIAPEVAVDALRATEALRAIQPPPEALWRPGTPCRLANGGLAGHEGVVMEAGKHTAIVAMLLFGHLRQVNVPIEQLAAREE